MKFVHTIIIGTSLVGTLVSCKKESVNNPAPVPPAPGATIEAVLKFNGNLDDSTGKLSGIVAGNLSFSTDRNGNTNSALYLDGSTKLTFSNLNLKGKSFTMSAWVKYFNGGGGLQNIAHAYNAGGAGPALTMVSDQPSCSISTPSTNSATAGSVNNSWHHVAATYDGADIRLYVDGALQATTNHPGSLGDGKRDLVVGHFLNTYWKGYLDDLRFYSEIKSANEIQKLSAQ